MKRWSWVLGALFAALLAYVVMGPYRTLDAIREAVRTEDASALARHVDFPALRASLKAQLGDRLVREAGANLQSSLLGAFGLRVATGLVDGMVDSMVTPAGLGALMEGRKLWNRASGIAPPSRDDGSGRPRPLQGAVQRYESPSRFTATVHDTSGLPLVFVLTRDGLHWQLSDVRLPMPPAPD
jgi:hypothetical protein